MERIFRRAASLVLLAGLLTTAEGRMICHHDSYTMKDGFCYRYVVSSVTYSQATERCKREQHGAGMLYIDSASENSYIWREMFSGHEEKEFWMGLDDQLNEGDFRWSHSKSQPTYTNFSSDIEDTNNANFDCVKFSSSGWQVAQDFCENIQMPFVCKAPLCVSSDGVICDEVRVSESGGGGLSAGAIAAIVIITIIIICIAVVLTILVLLWKFKNDAFHNYICPCVGRGSKRAMLSLQQENQRLRQELNQTKINTSNRFTAGQFGRESVSGVPDGMGGMLPPLKPGVGYDPGSSLSSPTYPPPLSLQRGTSRVTPMTPNGAPLFSPPPPHIFTAQSQRSARQSVSGGGQRGVSVGGAPLATLEEGEREDSSTASDDDTSLDKLVLPQEALTGGAGDREKDGGNGKTTDTEVKGQNDKGSAADDVMRSSSAEVKGQTEP